MKQGITCLDPTLLEVAEVLGIPPDTALQWIIEGRLAVVRRDAPARIIVELQQPLPGRQAGKLLILTKKNPHQKWQALAC